MNTHPQEGHDRPDGFSYILEDEILLVYILKLK